MKKLIPVIAAVLLLTSCGSDYDMNGTYTSNTGDLDLSVVICDSFCMIDVTSTNEDGGTATAVFDGTVSKENDIAVITIDEQEGVEGTRFEFLYNRRKGTLTSTSDNSVLKKKRRKDAKPEGAYTASDSNNDFELAFEDGKCTLTVNSINDLGQTASVSDDGTVDIDGNIVSIEFDDKTLDDDIYRFIYSETSDLLMSTSDGNIFKKQPTEE